MKNLRKFSRNMSAKFCFFGIENHDYTEVIEKNELTPAQKLTELQDNVKNTPESTEYQDQKSIDAALTAIGDGEKMPDGFDKIPASEFLKRSGGDLQILFTTNGIVDFRGNLKARRAIGLADLFPKISNTQQFVIVDNVSYAYGARRKSDGKIGYGRIGKDGEIHYKKITGDGEKISHFIGEPKEEHGIKKENYISLITNQDDKKIPPSQDFSYEKLVENSANYSQQMENLTVEEEASEKSIYLQNTTQLDTYEKKSRIKESALGLTENMEFKQKMEIIAKTVGESFNLPWEVIYAQGALESGRGKSGLSRQENNYFGIKGGTGKSWSTLEDYGNGLESETAKFRGYSSMYDSAIGYARFIYGNKRYRKAIDNYHTTKNPKEFLELIKKAGYATDSNYVAKVANVFKSDFGYNMPDKYEGLA